MCAASAMASAGVPRWITSASVWKLSASMAASIPTMGASSRYATFTAAAPSFAASTLSASTQHTAWP